MNVPLTPYERRIASLRPPVLTDATEDQLVAGKLVMLARLMRWRAREPELHPMAIRMLDLAIVSTLVALGRCGAAADARVVLRGAS